MGVGVGKVWHAIRSVASPRVHASAVAAACVASFATARLHPLACSKRTASPPCPCCSCALGTQPQLPAQMTAPSC